MTIEQAKEIAKKYVVDEHVILDLTRDILQANTEGYKECSTDFNEVYNRVTAGNL